MHDSYRPYDAARRRSGLERAGDRLLDYLRTRRSEHWIMFAAGLILGMLLG